MFRCEAVSVKRDGQSCLTPFSFSFPSSGIVGIVGANGSGKTTLLDVLSGYVVPSGGNCEFRGRNIRRVNPLMLARLGVLRTFQVPRVSEGMTVADNARLGLDAEADSGFWQRHEGKKRDSLFSILTELGLELLSDKPASALSLGEKRRLTSAFFVRRNTLSALIMDEPFSGLDQRHAAILFASIRDAVLRNQCIAIITEHREELLRELADQIITLTN